MNSAARCVVLVLGLGAVGPGGLAAQERRDTIPLEPIVVTATRLPTPLGAVANAVTVIRGEDLRAQGIAHVLDALRMVPGAAIVQTGSFGGQASLFVRGGESDYVRVLVDGVPVNQPGGTLDLANLSTDNVDRIEIVRGPTSVLYGSDAVTAVVQVFTRAGAGAPRGAATVRTGTYGTTAADVELSGGTDVVSYGFSASRFDSDGAYAFNNRYRNSTVAGLVRFAPDSRTETQLSVRYNDNRFHFPTDFSGALADSNQFTEGTGTTIGLEVGRFLTRRVEGRLLLASHQTDDRSDDSPDNPGDTEASRGRAELRRRSADIRANLHLGEGTVVTAGAVLEEQRGRTFFEYQGSFSSGGDSADVERTNRAYYVQALVGWRDRLSVTAGIRLERNEAFGTFRTRRIGAAYRLPGATRIRAVYGTAFKEPTFCETYGGCFATGNPDLRPERSESWEVGVEHPLWNGRAAVAAAYFDQRFRDVIQYSSAAGPGDPNFGNLAGASASGVELEARATPHARLSAVLRYTYLHTEASGSGTPLLRRPAHTANVALDCRLAPGGSLGLNVLYVGERDDFDFQNLDPVTFQPARIALRSYTRLDLAGAYEVLRGRPGWPGLAVTLRIENLWDDHYEEVRHFPARGRTVLAGARLALGQ